MPINILMPALSPTMKEGNLSKWHKAEGDIVEPGDVLAEIETDKAIMEVEAVDAGTLGKIVVPNSSKNVSVNTVIGILFAEGEDLESFTASETQDNLGTDPKTEGQEKTKILKNKISPVAARIAEQEGIDISNLSGSGPHGRIMQVDLERNQSQKQIKDLVVEDKESKNSRLFVSPLARRLAAESDINLHSISGTGPQGRIIKLDIDRAKRKSIEIQQRSGAALTSDFEDVKLNSMRKIIAERMVHSKSTVPHFYLSVDCEIDELINVMSSLNERRENNKLSINDFIIRACALALLEVPKANVSWLGDGKMRVYKTADISVAVALEDGLVTPIVRNAHEKGLAEISSTMRILAERGRAGDLKPEEYQGGSFTISNLGMFGIKQFDAVINEPQACILAVGAGEKRPVVREGKIKAATVMTCTLSCDHRVVDGVIGAKLLGAIKRLLEYPPEMLL